MPARDVVVMGASAGGLEPLREIVAALPADFPAAVLVVVHVAPDSRSVLPEILARSGPLGAAHCADGSPLTPGRICIAPPDRHLIIREDRVRHGRGARENNSRPAVDVLFRSAALCCGPRVIGVVLSGSLDDGTAGLLAIKERSGVAIAQDPGTAMFPGMPASAVANVPCDHIAAPSRIASLLEELVRAPAPEVRLPPPPEEMELEVRYAESAMPDTEIHPGQPSSFACPECGGALWEVRDAGPAPRYRCRVGHAYSTETLIAEQGRSVQAALWVALRALEENHALSRRLSDRVRPRHPSLAESYRHRADEARRHARTLRELLARGEIGAPEVGDGNGGSAPAKLSPPPSVGPAGQQ